MDWFDLSIEPLRGAAMSGVARPQVSGASEWLGGIRFPRRHADRPATVDPGGLMFLEVYSGARTWGEVAQWRVDVMAYGDGVRCPSGYTAYPTYPNDQTMPNVNVRFDRDRDRTDLNFGVAVEKKDTPGRWS
jgi:hypothetical protein